MNTVWKCVSTGRIPGGAKPGLRRTAAGRVEFPKYYSCTRLNSGERTRALQRPGPKGRLNSPIFQGVETPAPSGIRDLYLFLRHLTARLKPGPDAFRTPRRLFLAA